jgi:hypothetical protein
VKLGDIEYLIESTESRPDPLNPPLASRVGSRYVPEVLFDRHAIYVPVSVNRSWKGDYWSANFWTRIEPRAELGGDPVLSRGSTGFVPKLDGKPLTAAAAKPDIRRLANMSFAIPAAPMHLKLGDSPAGAREWSLPMVPLHRP